jgi:hypothetical protein
MPLRGFAIRFACVWSLVITLAGGVARADDGQDGEDAETRDRVDQAIVNGLEYLAAQQQPNGCWVTQSWGESTATTSLAVMSYLAAGHLPGEGRYGEAMNRGIRFVVDQQQENGLLVVQGSHGPMYSHGIATLMLAEVVGVCEEDDAESVRDALEEAIRLILVSQDVQKDDRQRGGWRYQPESTDSDLSVTAWQVLALRAAKDVGCDVPAEAIDEAIAYVRGCAREENGVYMGFGYQQGNGQTPTLTGTGITAMEVCGNHESPESIGGADWLLTHMLRPEHDFFYYGVYYNAIGMFKLGGEYADQTRDHLVEILLPMQQGDGSWVPQQGNERDAGQVYATSMVILALTVDYQYLPIYQR